MLRRGLLTGRSTTDVSSHSRRYSPRQVRLRNLHRVFRVFFSRVLFDWRERRLARTSAAFNETGPTTDGKIAGPCDYSPAAIKVNDSPLEFAIFQPHIDWKSSAGFFGIPPPRSHQAHHDSHLQRLSPKHVKSPQSPRLRESSHPTNSARRRRCCRVLTYQLEAAVTDCQRTPTPHRITESARVQSAKLRNTHCGRLPWRRFGFKSRCVFRR